MGNELEELKKENDSLIKTNSKLKKENNSLTEAQQGLKVKIKELSENKPKIISGHKSGSIKYVRQSRVKKKTD